MPRIDIGRDGIAVQVDEAVLVTLSLRRLGRHDLPEVERHLLKLGPADRRARFGTVLSDAAIAAYAWRIDPDQAVLIGAVDEPSGRILGLAEAQPADVPGWVELAVSVHASHQRHGLGRHLVDAALAAAFARGAEAAEFRFAPDNRPIAGLIQALGARIDATLDRAEIRRTQLIAQSQAI